MIFNNKKQQKQQQITTIEDEIELNFKNFKKAGDVFFKSLSKIEDEEILQKVMLRLKELEKDLELPKLNVKPYTPNYIG